MGEKSYVEEWGEPAELSLFRIKDSSEWGSRKFAKDVATTAKIFLDYLYRFKTHGEAMREFGIEPLIAENALSVLLEMRLIREDLPGIFDITSKGTHLWLEMFRKGEIKKLKRKDE